MLKLGELQFDERILDALHDKNLAVFAGAGVSMGAPANLPSFSKLALKIAEGTGEKQQDGESTDHFLGRLNEDLVRSRTVHHLSIDKGQYTTLHVDLLRLFGSACDVRIITTNFDQLFEGAASELWEQLPEVFSAPALPLGSDFEGLVHLHADITHPKHMVLTDRDFGRAYLTEGWARRFLVDIFRRYTVLFVGYSHDDTVMTYLSRALPLGDVMRYVLDSGSPEKWEHLGIKQIPFRITKGKNRFCELYTGVHSLADLSSRGILEWKSRITMLAKDGPSKDEATAGELKRALGELSNIRFFVAVAADKAWPEWLDDHGFLGPLFDFEKLDEQSSLFAQWLSNTYVLASPDILFALFAKHGTRINPVFWSMIARSVWQKEDEPPDVKILAKWISLLLARVPDEIDSFTFLFLYEQCARIEKPRLVLQVFLSMCRYRLQVESRYNWQKLAPGYKPEVECHIRCDEYSLNEAWEKYIKPHLKEHCLQLLNELSSIIENMHIDLENCEQANEEWDPVSYGRSAIEPHEQDQYRESIDVLIDASRDAMEWLGKKNLPLFDAWIEMLSQSPAPLLSRLAIHAIGLHPTMSGDSKIAWILERNDLYSSAEYHEVHHAIASAYISATEGTRKAVVDAVLQKQFEAFGNWTSEERTIWEHFSWLDFLLSAKPDCPIAQKAIAPIRTKHPNWRASEHPDLTHWSGPAEWVGPKSPISVDDILKAEPARIIVEYANYKGTIRNGPDRRGLLDTLENACKKDFGWACRLAAELVVRSQEDLDYWPPLLRGFSQSGADTDAWKSLFDVFEGAALVPVMELELANLLYSLVKNDGKTFALDLLERADTVALRLWAIPLPDEDTMDVTDWLSTAISHPAGILSEYWVESLSLLVSRSDGGGRVLPDHYKRLFEKILEDTTSKGNLARTVLCSQFAFLYSLDSDWASTHILIFFSEKDKGRFSQAWNGFLTWGRLNPLLARVMVPVFTEACGRIESSLPSMRDRFADFYAALALYYNDDPTVTLLPKYLIASTPEAREHLAQKLGFYLRNLDIQKKQDVWTHWLKRYLENRLLGAPIPFSDGEVKAILGWLPYNAEQYQEIVELIIKASPIPLGQSTLLYHLNKDGLARSYQESTAELIIYLCKGDLGWHESELEEILSQLAELPPILKQRLNEALARKGLDGLLE
jgi:hypothetical protein